MKCLKCWNFFSIKKQKTYSEFEEIEKRCLITGRKIEKETIINECTHFKEKQVEEKY